jgi:hypothetical protein
MDTVYFQEKYAPTQAACDLVRLFPGAEAVRPLSLMPTWGGGLV